MTRAFVVAIQPNGSAALNNRDEDVGDNMKYVNNGNGNGDNIKYGNNGNGMNDYYDKYDKYDK